MKMISGLQIALTGVDGTAEMIEILKSKEAFIVATVDGYQEFSIPLTSIPPMNPDEWFDLGPRPLPLEKTRFNCPAFAMLRYRMAPDLAQKR